MSKTKEELNKIKEEVETVNEKLQELTEEELEQVCGGALLHVAHDSGFLKAYLKGGGVSQLIN